VSVHHDAFRKWLRQVCTTQDEELDCDGVLELIPEYVDSEVRGARAVQPLASLSHHLEQCSECFDLYLTLRDVVQVEHQQVAAQPAG
jgi:predicted anti-sigma-YlaC factor YlaD